MKNRLFTYTAFFLAMMTISSFARVESRTVQFDGFIKNSTMTIGDEGEPYEQDGILWQPVSMVDTDADLQAAIPGKPSLTAVMFNDTIGFNVWYTISSKFQGNTYEIKTLHIYEPLASQEQLVEWVKCRVPEGTAIRIIESTQPAVESIVECFIEGSKGCALVRVYATKDRFYIAFVKEGDLSYSDSFFDAINILK